MDFIISKLSLVGPFFLLLGVLVFIHEWGHFIVARLCGVKVETFSIGFGPKIFKKKWGDTLYALGVIPLGGYVKMFGDMEGEEVPEEQKPQSFNHQSVYKKIAIVSAGPLMNLFFAFLIFMFIGFLGIPRIEVFLGDLKPQSYLAQKGLAPGDQITHLNGKEVQHYEEFQKELNKVQQESVKLSFRREGQTFEKELEWIEVPNPNPFAKDKKIKSFKDFSLTKESNLVGIAFDSPLAEKNIFGTQKIVAVNGQATPDRHQLTQALKAAGRNTLDLDIRVNKGETLSLSLEPLESQAWSFESLGLVGAELMVGRVQRGSPAAKAGLKKNDQLFAINDKALTEWTTLLEEIKKTKKGESVSLEVGREGQKIRLKMTPLMTELIKSDGTLEYRPTIGVMPALEYLPPKTKKVYPNGLSGYLSYGLEQSWTWTTLTLKGFKKLATGEVSHKTLSGVISIGKVAKDSLSVGWVYFFKMMAIISINLFLLNLLPVPVLDGGHLIFYFAEVIKGSPVSLKVRLIGQQIGLVLLFTLMAYTIFNDLTRIVFSGW